MLKIIKTLAKAALVAIILLSQGQIGLPSDPALFMLPRAQGRQY
jgi:hypothetical protein